MVSDKMFFAVFLPISTIAMFVVCPLFTFLNLQLFFAEDIIPYDLTQHLADGLIALSSIANDAPVSAASALGSASRSSGSSSIGGSKPESSINGHLQGIPVFTLNYHFNFLRQSDGSEIANLQLFNEQARKLIEHVESLPENERVFGFVHSAPLSVGSRGVLARVQHVEYRGDGSLDVTVKAGPPFELESVKNDPKVGFLVGDVELIPRAKVLYHVGQVVTHKLYGYRGVIIGVDKTCEATETWIQQMNVDQLSKGRTQPFYKVLVDSSHRAGNQETYVAHENIQIAQGAIQHNRLNDYFVEYDDVLHVYKPPH